MKQVEIEGKGAEVISTEGGVVVMENLVCRRGS